MFHFLRLRGSRIQAWVGKFFDARTHFCIYSERKFRHSQSHALNKAAVQSKNQGKSGRKDV